MPCKNYRKNLRSVTHITAGTMKIICINQTRISQIDTWLIASTSVSRLKDPGRAHPGINHNSDSRGATWLTTQLWSQAPWAMSKHRSIHLLLPTDDTTLRNNSTSFNDISTSLNYIFIESFPSQRTTFRLNLFLTS